MPPPPEPPEKTDSYVTMKDVADAVGVSKMTVSRALKGNHRGVAETTRKRIEEAAERLGYRRNPMVQSLMSQVRRRKTTTILSEIAAIVQDATCPAAQVGWRTRSMPRILDSIKKTAARNGFRLEVMTYRTQGDIARLERILHARNIKGVFVEAPLEVGITFDLPWDQLFCVTHDFGLQDLGLDSFAEDFIADMELVLRQLRGRGYQRIGFATSTDVENRTRRLKTATFLVYQNEIDEALRIPIFNTKSTSPEALGTWIEQHRPEVIIGNDAAYEQLVGMGLKVPTDIAFVGLTLWTHQPGIAHIEYDFTRLGQMLAEFLISRLLLNETGIPARPQTNLIPGKWVDGPSY